MLVTLSLGLFAVVGAVFLQVIAARVPEQRATLEKLITEHTGLAVRFENVRFAWGFDGTSAVFDRVELTDPVRGRVRVVAPELRMEFDTWDFLKHQQFTLGHVKLKSPDIEIIGDAEIASETGAPAKTAKSAEAAETPSPLDVDEATAIRRFIAWAELMPIGRIEVEAARVHLLRRGERAPRHSFTLSEANISRGSSKLSAFGTLLLSQDIGQSLFVSTKLDGLGSAAGVNGEVRLIARRVLLDKMSPVVERGRGTLDARIELRGGRVSTGVVEASVRELDFVDGGFFDHLAVKGAVRRAGQDLVLEFNDLQVTRASRLERTPRLTARVNFKPGSIRPVRTTLQAEHVPFMAAELLVAAFAPRLEQELRGLPGGWSATAGEFSAVHFDSGGVFRATLAGGEVTRREDRARVSRLAASMELLGGELTLRFDPAAEVAVLMPGVSEPRALRLDGALVLRGDTPMPQLAFDGIRLTSGDAEVTADGLWDDGKTPGRPLTLGITQVDRELLADVWNLLGRDAELPQLADLRDGLVETGSLQLAPVVTDEGRTVDWSRSRGSLDLARLASADDVEPRVSDAAGKLEITRSGTRLQLTAGKLEDLELTAARMEWPRQGEPRLQAALRGDLQSSWLRQHLAEQRLESLSGSVTIDAEARGEQSLKDPKTWRVSARLASGALAFRAPDVPPVESLAGQVRFADGQLRSATLQGAWLGGPVRLETRRVAGRDALSATVTGTADAGPLLELLGRPESNAHVNGKLAWSGTLNRDADSWRITLDGNLAGIESRLPAPFDKARSRQLPLRAELLVDAEGLREFEVTSGRDSIVGRVEGGATHARFQLRGVAGEFTDGGDDASRLELARVELRQVPPVLAITGSLLPEDEALAVEIDDLRHEGQGLGTLGARLARRGETLEFAVDTPDDASHRFTGRGKCALGDGRCDVDFEFGTRDLGGLIAVSRLPAEWPTRSLRAAGELSWPLTARADLTRQLAGRFEFEMRGADDAHQLVANATIADGQVVLSDLVGTGPELDQVFRGDGRVGLQARTYDIAVDYERLAIAATPMPSPARAGIARAWSALRGSAAKRGWTDTDPPRRVEWHGSWD